MAILKIKDKNGQVIDIPAIKGRDGVGIVSIEFDSSTHYKNYTLNQYLITYSDGTTSMIDIRARDGVGEKGKDGVDGVGIYEINLVKTEGLTKTYEIIYGNTEEYFEFTITDGYTPVVGQDYFTIEDKNELYAALRAQFLDVFITYDIFDELLSQLNASLYAEIPNTAVVDNNTLTFKHIDDIGQIDLFSVELPESQGGSIQSIEKTASSITADVYTITLTNGETSTFTVRHGIGISDIMKTNTNKLVDTYTITLNNLEEYTFTVTNGKNGKDGVGIAGFEYQETIEEDGIEKDVYYVYDTNDDYTELYIPHGHKGEQGHTPVKGTDYFTETDKEEMVQAVLAALPVAEEASF